MSPKTSSILYHNSGFNHSHFTLLHMLFCIKDNQMIHNELRMYMHFPLANPRDCVHEYRLHVLSHIQLATNR